MSKPLKQRIPRPLLHLDANTSISALHAALISRGHYVTRTPSDLSRNACDQAQLLWAQARGQCIFTFNIHDFLSLAERYPQHTGIILAVQSSWQLSDLIAALDRLLSETQPSDWVGRVGWLNEWRKK